MRPEAELLLACARAQLGAYERDRVRALLDAGVDFSALLRLAQRHRLIPLLFRHLDAIGHAGMPRDAVAAMWSWSERAAAHGRALAAELERVLQEFESSRIPALPFKGPVLARLLFGDVALRESSDLDILVHRDDVQRARLRLIALGYAGDTAEELASLLGSRAHYHAEFAQQGGVRVELHWKSDPCFSVEASFTPEWRTRAPVRGFTPAELVLVLCLHGSKHHWSSLAWLADVAQLLRDHDIDVAALAGVARAHGCERRLALGLRLAHELMDAPLDAGAQSWVASHAAALDALCDQLVPWLLDAQVPDLGALRRLDWDLRLFDRIGDRVVHALGVLLRPSAQDEHAAHGSRALAIPLRMARLLRKHLRWA